MFPREHTPTSNQRVIRSTVMKKIFATLIMACATWLGQSAWAQPATPPVSEIIVPERPAETEVKPADAAAVPATVTEQPLLTAVVVEGSTNRGPLTIENELPAAIQFLAQLAA